ncbi:hypothetical protein AUK18_01515 [Candidatus Beckwithbacteria bacterium CG2_30_44_31]|uniref:Membrane protein 6-pyruvoyl-tetrahydropterin synthase-related domain-containing protein n=1 Tax=Candidatus Beckwithbacteria bacterium CG2_30_44_31 TaxID=1805035 RepID=A0A1J5B9N4_9BACT|nr:MAG: hypothetical protein AUK18_01515 [Candidatus Beckwithbacteria bacterium CG2_30_44_31]
MKLIRKYWLLLLATVIVLPSIWPLFRSDFFRMHDWTHVARLVELDLALKAGQIPPRWAPDFGWGHGMPLFHFYNPLPYYAAEILYLIKLPAVWAIKTVFALNFLFGFYFMYLWAKTFWGKYGALVAATAFTYLPYRAVDFYVRGALGELTAMTFLPLLFYALKKKKLILTALAWTAVFLSHNVIALFSLFFIPLYLLFNLKLWKKFLLISLLTFGLSAFFILPAFFEKDLTVVNSLTGGFFHYSFHFIYLRQLVSRAWAYGGSILGPFDDISFQLGWPHLILALSAVRLWRRLTYFWLALAAAIFMMTFHSQFIWDRLPILALAQFPWRLLAFAATFVAFFSGSLFNWFKNKLIALVLIVLIIALNWQYFRPEKFSPVNDYYYTDRQRIANEMSGVLTDYLPKNYSDFPTATGGKTPLELWSDIISLLSWLGLLVYAVKFYRTRA